MELEVAVAWYTLDDLSPEQAIETAHTLLERGIYSHSLGQLTFEPPIWSEVGPLFAQALIELGVSIPSRSDAIRLLTKRICSQILSGEITPYMGAREFEMHFADDCANHPELRPIIDGYYHREYCPHEQIDIEIIQAARNLVEADSTPNIPT